MKRKQNTKGLSRGRTKSARGGRRTGGKLSSGRARTGSKKSGSRMSAKSTGRSSSRAIARPKSKAGVRAAGGAKGRSASKTKRGSGSRGLVKAMTRIKGKSPLKSTSEMRAKRASSPRASRSVTARSGANGRQARTRQPIGTNRRVSTSTKPSFGQVDISDIQRRSVDERISPQSDKPYTGADAFKPDAKGADTLMSAPPRKPIRQSRNQVGLRHH